MKTCIKYNSIEQLQYLITANLVNSYTRGDFVEIEHNGKRTWAIIAESEWDVTAGMYVLTAYASINWHYSEPAVEYNSMLATTLTMGNDIRVGRHLLKCVLMRLATIDLLLLDLTQNKHVYFTICLHQRISSLTHTFACSFHLISCLSICA